MANQMNVTMAALDEARGLSLIRGRDADDQSLASTMSGVSTSTLQVRIYQENSHLGIVNQIFEFLGVDGEIALTDFVLLANLDYFSPF